MYRLIKDNCIQEARSEGLKNEFLRMGYTLIENENNGEKAEEIKLKSPAPRKRKAVKKDEGQTED